jgi:hypothetical protein
VFAAISSFLEALELSELQCLNNIMHCAPSQEPSLYTGSSVMDRHPDQQQCCMAVAFKGAAWTDPDSVPLMVMQTMLGGWDRNNTSGKHAGESNILHTWCMCMSCAHISACMNLR